MSLKLPHWAQLVLAFVVVSIAWAMKEQAAGELTLPASVVTILTLVNTVIGIFSNSAKLSKAAASIATKTLGLLALVFVVGCSALGAVAPVLDCGSAIAADAAKGMSIAQIVEDLSGRCGLDVAGVIAVLAKSTDPTVTSSPAYAEAMRARSAFTLTDGGN